VPPEPATERRRWSAVQTLTGVIAGMLLAGLIVPMLVDSPRDAAPASAGAASEVAAGDDGVASGTGEALSGPSTTLPTSNGSSSGTASAATGAASAGTSTGGATGAADTSPIKVGFTLFDVAGAGKLGFAIGVDPEQEQKTWQAFVDWANTTGGINGRKINPVWSKYDVTNGDSQQQSCLELTQDNHVFAVLGGYSFPAANVCVVDTNKTLMVDNNAFTIDEVYRSGRHASIFMKASRMMANFAKRAEKEGLIRGKKIGILDDLGGDPTKSVINALASEVKAHGGNVVHESILSGDFSSGSPRVPIEVNQMRAAGAEVVLLLSSPLYGTQFVQEANGQGWNPTYAGSDWDVWYTDTGAQNMPDNFNGYSFTTVRTGEARFGFPELAKSVQCRQIYEQMTKSAAPPRNGTDAERNTYGSILQACDTMQIFVAAARAAGPTLDQSSFIAGIQRLGYIDTAAWGGGSFGPGKLDLNDRTRILRFQADCKCWKPTGQFE
jgi:ABC-type branched-subunit amino acid transport system substrate-binding protein